METNPPRNSWLQTHRNDEFRSEAENRFAPGLKSIPKDLPMPQKTHTAAAAVLLAVGSAQTSRAQTATGPAGRFQLLAGEHFIAGKGAGFDQKDVFRIDTVTGATSFFAEGVDKDGKAYIEWQPIK